MLILPYLCLILQCFLVYLFDFCHYINPSPFPFERGPNRYNLTKIWSFALLIPSLSCSVFCVGRLKAKATESLLFELSLGASIARGSFEALGNFDASRFLGSCGSFVLYCCPLTGKPLDFCNFIPMCLWFTCVLTSEIHGLICFLDYFCARFC